MVVVTGNKRAAACQVFSIGRNDYGQLGSTMDCGEQHRLREVEHFSGTDVCVVACGATHSLLGASDGTIHSWGCNSVGQLGLGHREHQRKPALVGHFKGRDFKLCAGGNHSVLSVGEELYAWGANNHGQLGQGDNYDRWQPTKVQLTGTEVAMVAAGYEHSIAVMHKEIPIPTSKNGMYLSVWNVLGFQEPPEGPKIPDQEVFGFGRNSSFQLGLGHRTNALAPTRISGMSGRQERHRLVTISGGTHITAAVSGAGAVLCCGHLNTGRKTRRYKRPTECKLFRGHGRVTQVQCGRGNVVALNAMGRVLITGRNESGQLGLGLGSGGAGGKGGADQADQADVEVKVVDVEYCREQCNMWGAGKAWQVQPTTDYDAATKETEGYPDVNDAGDVDEADEAEEDGEDGAVDGAVDGGVDGGVEMHERKQSTRSAKRALKALRAYTRLADISCSNFTCAFVSEYDKVEDELQAKEEAEARAAAAEHSRQQEEQRLIEEALVEKARLAAEEAERVSRLSKAEHDTWQAAFDDASKIYEETDECTLFVTSDKHKLCCVCMSTKDTCPGVHHKGRFFIPTPDSDLFETYCRIEGIAIEPPAEEAPPPEAP
jgi:hypothetical protein